MSSNFVAINSALAVAGIFLATSSGVGRTDEAGAIEQLGLKTLARFDQGDPGWKVRMESLQSIIKTGPAVTPLLVEALKNGSPSTREFAAQALVLVADPSARSALEQTVADSNA
ncbi:MAG: HEAT repeat domain-containing protein, partial [Gemmataceae bacterium]|nr:HEAT repeat domain-containing protein [Gemmataceae bacterium]